MNKLVKLIRSTSDERHCEIELCPAGNASGGEAQFLVNVREGQADAEWRESSKTPFAVSLSKAESIFAEQLASKLEQGFLVQATDGADMQTQVWGRSAAAPVNTDTGVPGSLQWGHSGQTLVTKNAVPASLMEQEKILLDRLSPRAWSGLSQRERTRTIWCIGERRLPLAVPRMVELLESGISMLDYCLAYAIGRSADAGAATAMWELSQRSMHSHVVGMARQAWLQLSAADARIAYAQTLIASWPADLKAAWEASDQAAQADPPDPADQADQTHPVHQVHQQESFDEVLLALPAAKSSEGWRYDDWLEQVDCIALSGWSPIARPLLLHQARTVALDTKVFRAFRHLYKAAEFRGDAQLFGILHQRFEKTGPLFVIRSSGDYVYLQRRAISYAAEVMKPDSRVAYSTLTRNYLRRRSWRTLRRFGDLGSAEFAHMAFGLLLACDDAEAGKAQVRELVRWNYETRSYDRELRYHSPYSQWMVFNQLLHRHQSEFKTSRTALSWWMPTKDASASYPARRVRQEAFPQLWDAAPELLLRLLLESRCLGVHAFAALALRDNDAFCQQLGLDQLRQLLQSAYLPTREFAFDVVKQRFVDSAPEMAWLEILLTADYAPAAEFALGFITKTPDLYAQEAGLLLVMISSPQERVRATCRLLAHIASAATREQVLSALLAWVQSAQTVPTADALPDMHWLVATVLATSVTQLSDAQLASWCSLLLAPQFWQQSLATEILVAHPAGIAHVPPQTLRDLLQDTDAGRQSLGSRLFAALPAELLLAQPDLVAALATADDARVRATMTPVITQLATHRDFVEQLLAHFIDVIFRRDTDTGGEGSDGGGDTNSVHADIINWCRAVLLPAALDLPLDLQWRLLQARSKGAQQLGAILLTQPQSPLAAGLTVLRWAQLGRHAIAQVRLAAQEFFMQNLPLIRVHLDDALRILDTRWPETRAFAADYFAQQLHAEDWSLASLLALCDHPHAAVQRLGRQLITRHFRVEDATDYVLCLSQHPAANMQLFVSQWLAQSVEAAADVDSALQQLRQLRPYFLSVLSHVNKARTVKNRVIAFLQIQGLASAAHAQFVAEIFVRQVLTVAIQDKAQYVSGLYELQARFPELMQQAAWPMQLVPPALHAAASGAVVTAETV